MTYSEIREAYQLSASLNKDIFIGQFSRLPSIRRILNSEGLGVQVPRIQLHPKNSSTTSKSLISLAWARRVYQTACGNHATGNDHIKNTSTRSIISRMRRHHSPVNPLTCQCLSRATRSFLFRRRIPSRVRFQSHHRRRKRRKRGGCSDSDHNLMYGRFSFCPLCIYKAGRPLGGDRAHYQCS